VFGCLWAFLVQTLGCAAPAFKICLKHVIGMNRLTMLGD